MDLSALVSGAVAPPSAADPSAQPSATGAELPPNGIAIEQPPATGAPPELAPDAAPAPPASASTESSSPAASTESSSPAAPTGRTYTEAEYLAAQQKAERYDQVERELRMLAAAAQQQQAEQAAAAETKARLDQVYQVAATMEPAAAMDYIRRHEEQERASLQATIRQIRQQSQQEMMAALAQVAAPLYAKDLAAKHGLPPEYADQLAMLSVQQQDLYVPVLVRQYQQVKTLQDQLAQLTKQIDQLRRTDQAAALAASGAHPAGGSGGSPVASAATSQVKPGTREHLLSDQRIARMFGYRPAQPAGT